MQAHAEIGDVGAAALEALEASIADDPAVFLDHEADVARSHGLEPFPGCFGRLVGQAQGTPAIAGHVSQCRDSLAIDGTCSANDDVAAIRGIWVDEGLAQRSCRSPLDEAEANRTFGKPCSSPQGLSGNARRLSDAQSLSRTPCKAHRETGYGHEKREHEDHGTISRLTSQARLLWRGFSSCA